MNGRRKTRTAVLRGKVKLMMMAETVPIPHRREPRAHGRESPVTFFDKGRIVLEMSTLLARWPGRMQLDEI